MKSKRLFGTISTRNEIYNENSKLLGIIRRGSNLGNLHYKFICLIFDKLGYSNPCLQDLEIHNKVFRYLKKKYKKTIDGIKYDVKDTGKESNDVWVCWLQGFENAPEIVKLCIRSIKKQMPDKRINYINQDNLFDYISVPEYIVKKWKSGNITNTFFSDIVRLELLIKYGGIWVDATTFFSGPLPCYINNSDFFVFRSSRLDLTKFGESWFIKARKDNRILKSTRDLLYAYCKKENKIRDYFLMFFCMSIAVEKYPQDIENMPRVPYELAIQLQNSLNDRFDDDVWNAYLNSTSIHKLSYKVEREDKEYETFYDYLVNHY